MAKHRLPVPPLETDPRKGLTREEAALRLRRGWSNRCTHRSGTTVWQILTRHICTYFNLVFLIMAALMLLVGAPIFNLTFLVIITLNTCIGCVQEIRAKRAVDKLSLVAAQKLPALRDGNWEFLPSERLVRDDIVRFRAGDQICADGILCEGKVLVNEALLTGEADPIEKNPGDTLLSGSFLVSGAGLCRLTQVGDDSYAARLAAEAKRHPAAGKSEMMASLDKLIHVLSMALVPVGFALFFSQMRSEDFTVSSGVQSTVAALVGMIPDGMYLLTSIALAASSLSLTRQRVLVQDMNCIETLARTDILCVDKTGTITLPEMALSQIIVLDGDFDAPPLLGAMFRDPENATGRAIRAAFPDPGSLVPEKTVPFTSETKWAGYQFRELGAFYIGAPEVLLPERSDIHTRVRSYSSVGQRVLLLARSADDLSQQLPEDLTPLALLVLHNPVRPQAERIFRYFAHQGVAVKVLSGDSPATVAAVAALAGIPGAEKALDATTLETEEDFRRAAENYTVFGRVTPEKKQKLIRAMKQAGHTVTMTGDGVNDVLAMKEADCSVAMAGGAQAANQMASLVLLDSDFAAFPGIVDEGRRVINNIRRSATLFLVKNIFSIGMTLVTLITGFRFPLESFHMSVVSSLTIGVPGFFLALEPNFARVEGRFLSTAYRKALPGGLTGILVVILAQILGGVFDLPATDIQSVATAILCAVGLAVLFWVSRPFTPMRRVVLGAMTIAVVGAFFVVPPVTGFLRFTDNRSFLLLPLALIAAPTVFWLLHRLLKLFRKEERPC